MLSRMNPTAMLYKSPTSCLYFITNPCVAYCSLPHIPTVMSSGSRQKYTILTHLHCIAIQNDCFNQSSDIFKVQDNNMPGWSNMKSNEIKPVALPMDVCEWISHAVSHYFQKIHKNMLWFGVALETFMGLLMPNQRQCCQAAKKKKWGWIFYCFWRLIAK